MRDVVDTVGQWIAEGRRVATATVVRVRGSAPRQPGAVMVISDTGAVAGSVSGGCVEGAVFELGQAVLADGLPRVASYGITDEQALGVGLTCGGEIDVLVSRVDPVAHRALAQAIRAKVPVAVATVLGGDAQLGAQMLIYRDRVVGDLIADDLHDTLVADARALLAQGRNTRCRYGRDRKGRLGAVTLFIEAFTPPPLMLVLGANDYAAAVVEMGAFLGYSVTLCDARPTFAAPERFPAAHVVHDWPHRQVAAALAAGRVDGRTAICVLTHDAKFDVPALEVALRSPAGYVGAMGSRRTHEDRLRRLREAGLREDELARLRSPIGLDLGGRSPRESAVAVAAELIQLRCGGTGAPLSHTRGAAHPEGAAGSGGGPPAGSAAEGAVPRERLSQHQ